MGTMFFMCPTTGHRVSTGVEMDPDCFNALPKHIVKVRCPHCSQPHRLSELVADTWQHRPAVHHLRKTLANREPSTHGTKRTNSIALAMSATDPKRTSTSL
jgi:transposase